MANTRPPLPETPIFTAGPSVTEKEITYVTDAITNGLNERSFEYITRFEKAFAEYVGVKHAVSTSSCTGALHLALWGLGIKTGDEVIVPDMTWIASAAPITYVGGVPVFVDIDPVTWCIDPGSVEKAITPKTRAIIAVHSYGYPANMDALRAIAERHKLTLIEDAAPSLGSLLNGKRTGSLGHVSAFSFHGSKIAAAGEGGMLCTDDDELIRNVRVIGNHGRDGGRPLTAARWGIKYNMSNLQAAYGLAQLERIDELLAKKKENYGWYMEELGGIEGLRLSTVQEGVDWNCWQTSFVMDRDFGIDRDRLMDAFKEVKIDTRPFFPPISTLPMVNKDLSAQNPNAYHAGKNGINLPSRHDLTREQAHLICEHLKYLLHV